MSKKSGGFTAMLVLWMALGVSGPSPAEAGAAVLVEYLEVPTAAAADLATVLAEVRARNEEGQERGEVYAWYHYRVRFPHGLERDYSDVIVTVVADFGSLEDPAVSAGYAGWIEKSEVYQPVAGVRSEAYGTATDFTHLTVDFLAAASAGRDALLEHLRTELEPRLRSRIEAGGIVNWGLFSKRLPLGREPPYTDALITRYDGFSQVEVPHFQAGETDRYRLVKSEVWELVDLVQ